MPILINPRPARRGSVPVRLHRFAPVDRNERPRIMLAAQAYDRRTHRPGWHGGALKRTGLAVLRWLLFERLNPATGRCDPSHADIAAGANIHTDTVRHALARLAKAGFLTVTPRRATVQVRGRPFEVQWRNAYGFGRGRPEASDTGYPGRTTGEEDQGLRRGKTTQPVARPPVPDPGRDLLAARRAAMEMRWRLGRPPPPG